MRADLRVLRSLRISTNHGPGFYPAIRRYQLEIWRLDEAQIVAQAITDACRVVAIGITRSDREYALLQHVTERLRVALWVPLIHEVPRQAPCQSQPAIDRGTEWKATIGALRRCIKGNNDRLGKDCAKQKALDGIVARAGSC